jgi:DNA invertase Pin-like site-specific DNA recombinase
VADFVAYYRVSTDRQGVSGLGLGAQRQAVQRHIAQTGQLVAEYTEIESGAGSAIDRNCGLPWKNAGRPAPCS